MHKTYRYGQRSRVPRCFAANQDEATATQVAPQSFHACRHKSASGRVGSPNARRSRNAVKRTGTRRYLYDCFECLLYVEKYRTWYPGRSGIPQRRLKMRGYGEGEKGGLRSKGRAGRVWCIGLPKRTVGRTGRGVCVRCVRVVGDAAVYARGRGVAV